VRWPDVRRHTVIALVIGLAAIVAGVVYAGAGAVAGAIASLHFSGLLLLVLLHLPSVAMMGFAWALASGSDSQISRARFVWARFVRDAAGELLPFLQLGGIVFGLRALGRGRALTVAAVSAGIDGVIELAAKLPYVFAALLALLALTSQPRLVRLVLLALAATGALVAVFLCAHRSLSAWLQTMARAISARWPALLSPGDGAEGADIQECFRRIMNQRARLWSAFALHLGCWVWGAGELWMTFRLLGIALTFWQALAIDGTVAALRTFGWLVPAAAGVQEASYMLGAAVFGISPAAAIAASLARRARDLVLGVGVLGIATVGDANFAPATLSMVKAWQRPRAR
jgi:putative membrane protein